jgi:hypothetical protein
MMNDNHGDHPKRLPYCLKCKQEFGEVHRKLWFKAYFNERPDQKPMYCRIHAGVHMVDVVRNTKHKI